MFRPLALLFSLMLAGAPQLSLVCKAWCAGADTATASCQHHESEGTRLTYDQTCLEDSLDVRNVIKKDVRSVSPPATAWSQALVQVGSHVMHSAPLGNADQTPSDLLGFLIPTVLRI